MMRFTATLLLLPTLVSAGGDMGGSSMSSPQSNGTCKEKNKTQCPALMTSLNMNAIPRSIYNSCVATGCFNFCQGTMVSCDPDFDGTALCPFDYVAGCTTSDGAFAGGNINTYQSGGMTTASGAGMMNGGGTYVGGRVGSTQTTTTSMSTTTSAMSITSSPQCGQRTNGHLCAARMASLVGVQIPGDLWGTCVNTGCFNFGCNANNFLHCTANFGPFAACAQPVTGCTLADLQGSFTTTNGGNGIITGSGGGGGGTTSSNEVFNGGNGGTSVVQSGGGTINPNPQCKRTNAHLCKARMQALVGVFIPGDIYSTCLQTGCFNFGCNANNFLSCSANFSGNNVCKNGYVGGCTLADLYGDGFSSSSSSMGGSFSGGNNSGGGQFSGGMNGGGGSSSTTTTIVTSGGGGNGGAMQANMGSFNANPQCGNRNRPNICRQRMQSLQGVVIPGEIFSQCQQTGCFNFGCNGNNHLNCDQNFQGNNVCTDPNKYAAGCTLADLYSGGNSFSQNVGGGNVSGGSMITNTQTNIQTNGMIQGGGGGGGMMQGGGNGNMVIGSSSSTIGGTVNAFSIRTTVNQNPMCMAPANTQLCQSRMAQLRTELITQEAATLCQQTGCYNFGCNANNFLNCDANFQGVPGLCNNYVAGCTWADLFVQQTTAQQQPVVQQQQPVIQQPVVQAQPTIVQPAQTQTNTIATRTTATSTVGSVATNNAASSVRASSSSGCSGKGKGGKNCGKGGKGKRASASQRADVSTSGSRRAAVTTAAAAAGTVLLAFA